MIGSTGQSGPLLHFVYHVSKCWAPSALDAFVAFIALATSSLEGFFVVPVKFVYLSQGASYSRWVTPWVRNKLVNKFICTTFGGFCRCAFERDVGVVLACWFARQFLGCFPQIVFIASIPIQFCIPQCVSSSACYLVQWSSSCCLGILVYAGLVAFLSLRFRRSIHRASYSAVRLLLASLTQFPLLNSNLIPVLSYLHYL